mmetsp:Transcript_34568/g.99220  ORF Transcript_34568/g.99220 Transcript_34568/m.99220 type:complete len:396 (+) Transcript_34568:546-1733(+)
MRRGGRYAGMLRCRLLQSAMETGEVLLASGAVAAVSLLTAFGSWMRAVSSSAARCTSALNSARAASARASAALACVAASVRNWSRSSPPSLCRRELNSTRSPASICPTSRASQPLTSERSGLSELLLPALASPKPPNCSSVGPLPRPSGDRQLWSAKELFQGEASLVDGVKLMSSPMVSAMPACSLPQAVLTFSQESGLANPLFEDDGLVAQGTFRSASNCLRSSRLPAPLPVRPSAAPCASSSRRRRSRRSVNSSAAPSRAASAPTPGVAGSACMAAMRHCSTASRRTLKPTASLSRCSFARMSNCNVSDCVSCSSSILAACISRLRQFSPNSPRRLRRAASSSASRSPRLSPPPPPSPVRSAFSRTRPSAMWIMGGQPLEWRQGQHLGATDQA